MEGEEKRDLECLQAREDLDSEERGERRSKSVTQWKTLKKKRLFGVSGLLSCIVDTNRWGCLGNTHVEEEKLSKCRVGDGTWTDPWVAEGWIGKMKCYTTIS